MKNKRRSVLRVMSLALAVSFVGQEICLAAPQVAPQTVAIARPEVGFVLPQSVAVVEDAYKAPAAPDRLIILIQDAHTNDSGQMNLARALAEILPKEKIRTVFTEGADGDVSVGFFKPHFTQRIRETVGRRLVREGEMKGAEYYNLIGDHDFNIWGVEDQALYREALVDYRRAAGQRGKALGYLDRLERAATALKADLYSEPLAAFDAVHTRYLAGELGLTAYFDELYREAKRLGVYLGAYRELEFLNRLKRLESGIDFDRARSEQSSALASLPAADRKDLETLAKSKRVPGRLGAESQTSDRAYFLLLEEKLRASLRGASGAEAISQRNVSRNYPQLAKYFSYLRESSDLDAPQVLAELSGLEREVFERLARTQDEKLLAAFSRNLKSLKNLLSLKITPDEYEASKREAAWFDIRNISGFVNRKIMDLDRRYDFATPLDADYAEAERTARAFYDLTYRRDRVFVDRMLERLAATGESRAVLVTGGFHAANLKELFKREGISYVSLLPQVLHETDSRRYEKLLFAGLKDRKISVAGSGAAGSKQTLMTGPINAARLAGALTAAAGGAEPWSLERIDLMRAQVDRAVGPKDLSGSFAAARLSITPFSDHLYDRVGEMSPDWHREQVIVWILIRNSKFFTKADLYEAVNSKLQDKNLEFRDGPGTDQFARNQFDSILEELIKKGVVTNRHGRIGIPADTTIQHPILGELNTRRAAAVKFNDVLFIRGDLASSINSGKADFFVRLQEYSNIVSAWYRDPNESRNPIIKAVLMSDSADKRKMTDWLKSDDQAAYVDSDPLAFSLNYLLSPDPLRLKRYMASISKKTNISQRNNVYVAGEINFRKGGLGPVGQNLTGAMRKFFENPDAVYTIQPQFVTRKSDGTYQDVDYSALAVPVVGVRRAEDLDFDIPMSNGRSARMQVSEGTASNGVKSYLIRDADGFYVHEIYVEGDGTAKSNWQQHAEFVSRASLQLIIEVEKRKQKATGSEYLPPVMHFNDSQLGFAPAFFRQYLADEEASDAEFRRIFGDSQVIFTTHTIRNRREFQARNGADEGDVEKIIRDPQMVKHFDRLGRNDVASGAISLADLANGVSSAHAEWNAAGLITPFEPLIGIANAADPQLDGMYFRRALVQAGWDPNAGTPTSDQVDEAKRIAKDSLNGMIREFLTEEQISAMGLDNAERLIERDVMTLIYSGRDVKEKNGEEHVFTRDNMFKLAESLSHPLQIVWAANVQGDDWRNHHRMVELAREINSLPGTKLRILVLNGWAQDHQRQIFAATDVSVQPSTWDRHGDWWTQPTEANGFTEVNVYANAGVVIAPSGLHGGLQMYGVVGGDAADEESLGTVFLPRTIDQAGYLEAIQRRVRKYYGSHEAFVNDTIAALVIEPLMAPELVAAEYLRQASMAIERAQDPINVLRGYLSGDPASKFYLKSHNLRKRLVRQLDSEANRSDSGVRKVYSASYGKPNLHLYELTDMSSGRRQIVSVDPNLRTGQTVTDTIPFEVPDGTKSGATNLAGLMDLLPVDADASEIIVREVGSDRQWTHQLEELRRKGLSIMEANDGVHAFTIELSEPQAKPTPSGVTGPTVVPSPALPHRGQPDEIEYHRNLRTVAQEDMDGLVQEMVSRSLDIFVVTAWNQDMADLYRAEFESRRGVDIRTDIPILIVPNPEGSVGNGGMLAVTIAMIQAEYASLQQRYSHLKDVPLENARICVLQAGGFGTRHTASAALGTKPLMPLPFDMPGSRGQRAATPPDFALLWTYKVAQILKAQTRGGLIVPNGDGIYVADMKDAIGSGIHAFASVESMSKSHRTFGLFVLDRDGKVIGFREKPTIDQMSKDTEMLLTLDASDLKKRQLLANTAYSLWASSSSEEQRVLLDVLGEIGRRILAEAKQGRFFSPDTSGDIFIPKAEGLSEQDYLAGKKAQPGSPERDFWTFFYRQINSLPNLIVPRPDPSRVIYTDYGTASAWVALLEGDDPLASVFDFRHSIGDLRIDLSRSSVAIRSGVPLESVPDDTVVIGAPHIQAIRGLAPHTLLTFTPVELADGFRGTAVLYTDISEILTGTVGATTLQNQPALEVLAKIGIQAQASDPMDQVPFIPVLTDEQLAAFDLSRDLAWLSNGGNGSFVGMRTMTYRELARGAALKPAAERAVKALSGARLAENGRLWGEWVDAVPDAGTVRDLPGLTDSGDWRYAHFRVGGSLRATDATSPGHEIVVKLDRRLTEAFKDRAVVLHLVPSGGARPDGVDKAQIVALAPTGVEPSSQRVSERGWVAVSVDHPALRDWLSSTDSDKALLRLGVYGDDPDMDAIRGSSVELELRPRGWLGALERLTFPFDRMGVPVEVLANDRVKIPFADSDAASVIGSLEDTATRDFNPLDYDQSDIDRLVMDHAIRVLEDSSDRFTVDQKISAAEAIRDILREGREVPGLDGLAVRLLSLASSLADLGKENQLAATLFDLHNALRDESSVVTNAARLAGTAFAAEPVIRPSRDLGLVGRDFTSTNRGTYAVIQPVSAEYARKIIALIEGLRPDHLLSLSVVGGGSDADADRLVPNASDELVLSPESTLTATFAPTQGTKSTLDLAADVQRELQRPSGSGFTVPTALLYIQKVLRSTAEDENVDERTADPAAGLLAQITDNTALSPDTLLEIRSVLVDQEKGGGLRSPEKVRILTALSILASNLPSDIQSEAAARLAGEPESQVIPLTLSSTRFGKSAAEQDMLTAEYRIGNSNLDQILSEGGKLVLRLPPAYEMDRLRRIILTSSVDSKRDRNQIESGQIWRKEENRNLDLTLLALNFVKQYPGQTLDTILVKSLETTAPPTAEEISGAELLLYAGPDAPVTSAPEQKFLFRKLALALLDLRSRERQSAQRGPEVRASVFERLDATGTPENRILEVSGQDAGRLVLKIGGFVVLNEDMQTAKRSVTRRTEEDRKEAHGLVEQVLNSLDRARRIEFASAIDAEYVFPIDQLIPATLKESHQEMLARLLVAILDWTHRQDATKLLKFHLLGAANLKPSARRFVEGVLVNPHFSSWVDGKEVQSGRGLVVQVITNPNDKKAGRFNLMMRPASTGNMPDWVESIYTPLQAITGIVPSGGNASSEKLAQELAASEKMDERTYLAVVEKFDGPRPSIPEIVKMFKGEIPFADLVLKPITVSINQLLGQAQAARLAVDRAA